MKRIITAFSITTACFLVLLHLTYAETIILKSGQRFQGKILERTDKDLKIEYYGVPLTYSLEEIAQFFYLYYPEENAIFDTASAVSPESGFQFPEYSEALSHIQTGRKLLWQKQYIEAEKEFQKAVELSPNFGEVYVNLALARYFMNDYKVAEEYLNKKVIPLNPLDARGYGGLGAVNYKLGRYQQAVEYLEKAIQLEPAYPVAYQFLGQAFLALGKNNEARENFLKAKELFQNVGDTEHLKAVEEYLNKLQIPPSS